MSTVKRAAKRAAERVEPVTLDDSGPIAASIATIPARGGLAITATARHRDAGDRQP